MPTIKEEKKLTILQVAITLYCVCAAVMVLTR
jgi:hypothetical protein